MSYQLRGETNQPSSPSTTKIESILESSNEALVQACRSGDPLAWEALIRRYQRLVYSIPYRAGLDQDRSAEVFQRVFEKLVKHLDRIEQPDPWSG